MDLSTDLFSLGKLYKTSSFGQTSGSKEITGTFTILEEVPFPVIGETLNKMGASSGWTQGPVIATCVNVTVSGGRELLCQDQVEAGIAGGDSGAPVFWGQGAVVTLYGVAWAGGSSFFYFSNMSGIEADLGELMAVENP